MGKNTKEHNERLCAVLNRIRQANMKLNKAKCKIGLTEVAGHVFGSDGLKPSGEKIRAILEIPEPRNKKELQRFMGTVNYLGKLKFIPNLSGINQPLQQLLEKDVAWHWGDAQDISFKEL